MFKFEIKTKWSKNLKDKMITFVDLYRKKYNEPIQDIIYKREPHDDYRMIITFKFKCVDIQFEGVEKDGTNWISMLVEIDSDDKEFFDGRYDFISKTIKGIK